VTVFTYLLTDVSVVHYLVRLLLMLTRVLNKMMVKMSKLQWYSSRYDHHAQLVVVGHCLTLSRQ